MGPSYQVDKFFPKVHYGNWNIIVFHEFEAEKFPWNLIVLKIQFHFLIALSKEFQQFQKGE